MAALNARSYAGFGAQTGVHDLKSEHASGVLPGVSDEHRQNAFRPIDRLPPVEDLWGGSLRDMMATAGYARSGVASNIGRWRLPN